MSRAEQNQTTVAEENETIRQLGGVAERGSAEGTSGRRGGRGRAGFLAVFEAIALAVQLQDVDVVGQSIEQRAGEAFGPEDLGLFVEGQIRGHERRRLLVALGEDLK